MLNILGLSPRAGMVTKVEKSSTIELMRTSLPRGSIFDVASCAASGEQNLGGGG